MIDTRTTRFTRGTASSAAPSFEVRPGQRKTHGPTSSRPAVSRRDPATPTSADVEVAPDLQHDINPAASLFKSLPIAPDLLNVLGRLGFVTPTPIQSAAVPIGLSGRDIIGVAQTGTGKTLAFGIPIVQSLHGKKGRALVIVPTRELALQVAETLHALAGSFRMRTVTLIGGAPMGPQVAGLRVDPQIVVATPGRLIDHLEQGNIFLDGVKTLVLDEADRMLDMGFAPQIERILRSTATDRQTMLFSATMPDTIVEIARDHMRDPERVEIARSGSTVENVTQELAVVEKEDKPDLLLKLLYKYDGPVLVFSRTKHGAKKILRELISSGHSGAEIHANRTLNQRREALNGFKTGRYRILVATDIAARGIDVANIQLVVNYDIPEQAEDYVHRVGRTGRAGRTGHAITFAMPDQGTEVRDIERLIRRPIPVSAESQGLLLATSAGRKKGKAGNASAGPKVGAISHGRGGRPPGSRPQQPFGRSAQQERTSPEAERRPSARLEHQAAPEVRTPTPSRPTTGSGNIYQSRPAGRRQSGPMDRSSRRSSTER